MKTFFILHLESASIQASTKKREAKKRWRETRSLDKKKGKSKSKKEEKDSADTAA